MVKTILGVGNSVVVPVASELLSKNKNELNSRLFLVGLKLNILIFVPFVITIMILAEKILLLWVGSEYVQYGFLMQVILVIPLLSLFISHGGSILLGMNVKMKLFAYLAWLIFIANTLFTLLTIEEWELTSVVVGRIIGLLIAIPIANIAFIKVFKINSKEYSFSLAMLVLLLVVPYYVNFVLLDMWNQNSISNLLFSGIVLYIISTVLIYVFILRKEDKEYVKRILQKIINKKVK